MNERSDRSRLWLWVALALTAVKLWLTAGQPVFAIGHAMHDDALFLQLAESLVRGEWLGGYHQLTLAKGPFYSLWIAFFKLTGVPLFLSQQLLYAAACAALVWACRPALASAGVRFGFYALLLWNPMTFEASSLGRVLRQHLYASLGLLLFAGLAALYFRRRESWRRQLPWAVLLGVSFGAFYLTREETLWIAPSLVLISGALLCAAARDSLAAIGRSVAQLALAAACAFGLLLTVSALNYHYYGWFGTVEYRDPAFNDAYGAMVRVRIGPELARVPVTRQAREAMYAVSPTFAQLRPHLEGELGRNWATVSTSVTGQPIDERQIGGGWLMWALRDAVAAAGHAHNAAEAHAFYRAMADELNAACDLGRLPAGPRRSGFLPVWREGEKTAVARTVVLFADFVVSFSRFSAHPPPSAGDVNSLALFRRMTAGRLSPTVDGYDPDPTPFLATTRVATLHAIGKFLRHVLFWLFVAAQTVVAFRVVHALVRRTWAFPLTLAAAAWGGGLACLTIQAIIHVTSFPVLVVASFASIYPLVPLFICAVAWDAVVAWRPPGPTNATPGQPGPAPSPIPPSTQPEPIPADGPWEHRLPWLGGLLALAPFLLWHGQFTKLFWFADDLFLVDEISLMGLRHWLFVFFTESFVPLFKLGWGGALHLFGGSYGAMLWLLWLNHAVNTGLLGRLLLRAGFPWLAAVWVQLVFGLAPGNLETLGWSVQWSALLATMFLLLALLWLEKHSHELKVWSGRAHLPLVLCAGASACCFARGVLTGGVLAAELLLPALLAGVGRPALRRLPAATACVVPAIAVALAILLIPSGNQRQLAGHAGEILRFAATFLFLSPGYLLFGMHELNAGSVFLLGALKIFVVLGGFALARGRVRVLLGALLLYDLGNAVLLGVGRYHTGATAALGSRYLYSSLLATLPFAGLVIARLVELFSPRERTRGLVAGALLTLVIVQCLRGWPVALEPFVARRGIEMRHLMQAPYTIAPEATVPALNFMHLERAKALQRAYDLH